PRGDGPSRWKPADAGIRAHGGGSGALWSRGHRRLPGAAAQAAHLRVGACGCAGAVSCETEERNGDMIAAIERGRRKNGSLDSDDNAEHHDMAEDAIE